jgi:hypothetical protein
MPCNPFKTLEKEICYHFAMNQPVSVAYNAVALICNS